MRGLLVTALVLTALGPLRAQLDPVPVEELLKRVNGRLTAMHQQFETILNDALSVFRSQLPTDRVRSPNYVRELAQWVGVFPNRFAELAARESWGRSRRHVLDAVVLSKETACAPHLASILDSPESAKRPSVIADVISCLGQLGNKRVASRIRAILDRKPVPKVLAQAVLALARLEHPDAADLAKTHMKSKHVGVREAAYQAIAEGIDGSRSIATFTMDCLRTEENADARAAGLRALARFHGNHEVLKILHATLAETERIILEATLDALEKIGRKDMSGRSLVEFITKREMIPPDLKSRASRILLTWGSMAGVNALVRPLKDLADKRLRDADLQMAVADRYRDLGAYKNAIDYYKKSLGAARRMKTPMYRGLARCYARLGHFRLAKKALLDAGYTDLSPFKDEEDFLQMQRHRDYAALFEG